MRMLSFVTDQRRFLQMSAAAFAWPGIATAGDGTERAMSLPDGPRHWREFRLPSGGAGRPAIILLHGGGQSMHSVLGRRAGGSRRWRDIARREGCVLLVPSAPMVGSPCARDYFRYQPLLVRYLFFENFRAISSICSMSFCSSLLKFNLKRKCLRLRLTARKQTDRESSYSIGAKPWPRPSDYKTS